MSVVQWVHSCMQGDLKSSSHSALKRRGQRWISGRETEREAFVNGRKSKPIMHLIILLCGLFMHLISSHPYSLLTKALTHVLQTTAAS